MKQSILKKLTAKIKSRQKLLLLSLFLILLAFSVFAQNCPTSGSHTQTANENTYFPGTQTSVSAGSTSINIGAAGSGTTGISIGDIVFIIQMQGAQFNLPASNTATGYGNTSGSGSGFISTNIQVGHMEFAVATNSLTTAGGTLNIASGLTYPYIYSAATATSGQYTYQVIRVPSFYNLTLSGVITAPNWNGSTGGVIIINAVNQITLGGATVSADAAGFRGGGGRKTGGNATATKLDFYVTSTFGPDGSKGEGIAGTPRFLNYNNALVDNVVEGYPGGSYARGAPGNAGGGATDSNPTSNNQNAGGGGGGNGGAGGLGGNGWFSFGFTGGHGGTAFSSWGPVINYSSPSRLIMGGGGGAGDSNDGTGTPGNGFASSGAAGGGIIILNATSITGVGTLSASGANGNNTVLNDASGGGGAGGSILIYANSGQSGITAIANGGNGGSNNPLSVGATQHGPGGSGGGGVIYSNAPVNATSSVNTGIAGISAGTNATDNFGAGIGTNGILTTTFPFSALPPNMQICQTAVLPVTILNFSASYANSNDVAVSWSTTNEVNASYFEVERSENAIDFTTVGQVNASQTGSSSVNDYHYNDNIAGVNASILYYRLKVVDADGKFVYSKIVPIKLDQSRTGISVYPNPVDNYTTLSLYADQAASGVYRLFDNAGKQITSRTFNVNTGTNSITIDQLSGLAKGVYVVQVMVNNNIYTQKLIKR